MPNGGPTPDCAHCLQAIIDLKPRYLGGECSLHRIRLFSLLRLFCADWAPLTSDDDNWLKEYLQGYEAQSQAVYWWIESYLADSAGNLDHRFDPAYLTDVNTYRQLTKEELIELVRAIVQKQHKEYEEQGYQIR